jgi:hypothetical protein
VPSSCSSYWPVGASRTSPIRMRLRSDGSAGSRAGPLGRPRSARSGGGRLQRLPRVRAGDRRSDRESVWPKRLTVGQSLIWRVREERSLAKRDWRAAPMAVVHARHSVDDSRITATRVHATTADLPRSSDPQCWRTTRVRSRRSVLLNRPHLPHVKPAHDLPWKRAPAFRSLLCITNEWIVEG